MGRLKFTLVGILLFHDICQADVKVYPVPPTTIGGGGVLCSTGGSNGSNAFDLLLNTFSSLNITVGALCTVYQDFTFVQSSNMVGSDFHVYFSASNGSSLLGLGALATSSVILYDSDNNIVTSANLNSSLINLSLFSNAGGFNIYEITMPVEAEFVKARVRMSGIFLFNGFRVYEIYYQYSPLPVELAYFKAERYNNSVALFWKTYSELNNDHFEVYSSIDGKEYTSVGTLKGNGTTVIPQNYSITHSLTNQDKPARMYYRLVQADMNGTQHNYPDYVINLKTSKYPEAKIALTHKSGIPVLKIKNMDDHLTYAVKIFGMDGRLVFESNINSVSEYEKQLFNIQPGVYVVRVAESGTENAVTEKITL